MIETQSVSDLIEQQIKIAVEQQVAAAITEKNWLEEIEKKTVKHVQDRITAKFSSLDTVPELIKAVQDSVIGLFDQGAIPGVDAYVDQATVTRSVDQAVQNFMGGVIEHLTQDVVWIEKIEKLVTQQMSLRLSDRLSNIDLDSIVVAAIDRSIDKWQSRLKQDFCSTGIVDQGIKTELVIMNDAVVVENQLATNSLLVDKDATVNGTITLNNLVVKGAINTDNHSWDEITNRAATDALARMTAEWQQSLVQQVLDIASTSGIDFDSIKIGGQQLVNGNTLNKYITDTNIEKTGVLREVKVAGHSEFNETLTVNHRRVGINTQDPEMALSVWDEEVSVIMGKLSKQQAYVGSGRLQNLAIGVNRKPQIELDIDGLTTIKQLRVGQHRIGHDREVPGYSGTRGDLVFNSDPKPGSAFAWVCLGAFKWQPIRGV